MKNSFTPARRLDLPDYPFAKLERKAAEIISAGQPLNDLSIGDPDLPPPEFVIKAISRALREKKSHTYPSSRGDRQVRNSVSFWFKGRFGVELDPESQICILIGAKEGLSHLARAVVNPGDIVAVPDPAYPVYWRAGCRLLEADLKTIPLLPDKMYLPDLSQAGDVRLLYLNYPNNPTGAVATDRFLRMTADLVESNPGLTVAYDMAYSEMTFGSAAKSILQFTPGAVEFHSLSKMANATGFRVGFAVGDQARINALVRMKEEVDSGVPYPYQMALAATLDRYNGDEPPQEIVGFKEKYRIRRENLIESLEESGFLVFKSDATFYVWFKVGVDEMDFVDQAITAGILFTPGSAFGESGRGWVRASVTAPDDTIDNACNIIRTLV